MKWAVGNERGWLQPVRKREQRAARALRETHNWYRQPSATHLFAFTDEGKLIGAMPISSVDLDPWQANFDEIDKQCISYLFSRGYLTKSQALGEFFRVKSANVEDS